MNLIFFALLSVFAVERVVGHGRLMNPPARNSMWRHGYPNPVNFNDNELFCGGYGVQWSPTVGGKCGVCGDPWTEKVPRSHETGGLFGDGLKGRRYTPGQIIDVEVELTANHRGYFEMRLCPLTNLLTIETQECFNGYPLMVEGLSSPRYTIPESTGKQAILNYHVKLPDGITCTHCVIQWIYYAANTWGVCENGTGSVGCGQQETFRNCADVAIITNTGGFGPLGVVPSAPSSLDDNPYAVRITSIDKQTGLIKQKPLVVRSQVCLSRIKDKSSHKNNEWCMQNCLKYPPTCPEEDCQCLQECVPTGDYASVEGADVYCHINCMRYPQDEKCPDWCSCS